MDLDDRMKKVFGKKKGSKKPKAESKKKKNTNKSVILQSYLDTIEFTSSDDDFEAPRFIVRSPRSGRKANGQGVNQTYREDVTPRRPSDKVKSVRHQSRSRDRTTARTPNTRIGNLEFTSDESDPEEDRRRNRRVRQIETQPSLITDVFPQKKKSSTMKTSAKKKGQRLIIGEDDSQEPRNKSKQGRVLVQDTEEDGMDTGGMTDRQTKRVVENSYVPETEESGPNRVMEQSELTVPESLVAETQEPSQSVGMEVSDRSIPDSYVPDSESTDKTKICSSGTTVVPDSYVPDTQSATQNSVNFEVDTIPDSQDVSDKEGHSTYVSMSQELKNPRKTKKKKTSQKTAMKLFEQFEFSSDSSFGEDSHDNVETTFHVRQAATLSFNPIQENTCVASSDFSTRLQKILAKETRKPKKTAKKGRENKSGHNIKLNPTKQIKESAEGKENIPSGTMSDRKLDNAKSKRINVFEMFDFSSSSDESSSSKVTENFSDVCTNTTRTVDASVIEALSQRFTSIMGKKCKEKKKRKNESKQPSMARPKNISLQVSIMPESSEDSANESEAEISHRKQICNMSVQVSMLEEKDEAEEFKENSATKAQNMSLQVSIMESDEEDVENPAPVTKNMSLQVSVADSPSSDNLSEGTASSSHLALHLSEISDANTTSEIKNKTNATLDESHHVDDGSVRSNESSLQDAQRDSVISSDHDDTLLSNESSAQSNHGEQTVFQTPPEDLDQSDKTGRYVSSGASPTLSAYKTSKQDLHTKRLSTGACSSSFYVAAESDSFEEPGHNIPQLRLSYEEESSSKRKMPSLKAKSTPKTPGRAQDETGYASMVGTSTKTHDCARSRRLSDSSDDEDQLESFLSQQRNNGSKAKIPETCVSMDGFIVTDSDMSECELEEDDDGPDGSVFYIQTDRTLDAKGKTPSRKQHTPVNFDSESDDEQELRPVFKTPAIPPVVPKTTSLSRPKSVAITPKRTPLAPHNANTTGHEAYRWSFLRSLAGDTPNVRRHPDSMRFIRDFKKHREELTKRLFKLYNETVFENKLPDDMSVAWNQRLYKTAGYCAYRKTTKSSDVKTARIELSVKVCDSPERVRDTLLHEMCHAAVWVIYGVNDGHGPYWKYFALKACAAHPELPPASRCHNYDIHHKFTYRCIKCGYQIHRHSKSLNTTKKVCGHCKGEFELLVNRTDSKGSVSKTPHTPRTPSKFAMFVKENYDSVKKSAQGLKHKDVMVQLSKDFAKTKLN